MSCLNISQNKGARSSWIPRDCSGVCLCDIYLSNLSSFHTAQWVKRLWASGLVWHWSPSQHPPAVGLYRTSSSLWTSVFPHGEESGTVFLRRLWWLLNLLAFVKVCFASLAHDSCFQHIQLSLVSLRTVFLINKVNLPSLLRLGWPDHSSWQLAWLYVQYRGTWEIYNLDVTNGPFPFSLTGGRPFIEITTCHLSWWPLSYWSL